VSDSNRIAKALVDAGCVRRERLDSKERPVEWIVSSREGRVYHVVRDEKNRFTCFRRHPYIEAIPCEGWKFRRVCKHIKAVVIYELRQRNLSCSFWDDLWDALRQKKKWYPLKTTRGAVCYYTVWRR